MKPESQASFVYGRLCKKHPELQGRRYAGNRNCVACGIEHSRATHAKRSMTVQQEITMLRGQLRQAREESEALRSDARRWQCVRNAIQMQSPYAVWREGSHVVLGKDADDLVDNFLANAKDRGDG